MKNLKNLKGVKELSKNEQKKLNGGRACDATHPCPIGYDCIRNMCRIAALAQLIRLPLVFGLTITTENAV